MMDIWPQPTTFEQTGLFDPEPTIAPIQNSYGQTQGRDNRAACETLKEIDEARDNILGYVWKRI